MEAANGTAVPSAVDLTLSFGQRKIRSTCLRMRNGRCPCATGIGGSDGPRRGLERPPEALRRDQDGKMDPAPSATKCR